MDSNKRFLLLPGLSLLPWITTLAALSGTPVEPKQAVAGTQEATKVVFTETISQAHEINACSPDGNYFISTSPDGRLRYCRAADGTVVHIFYHCSPKSLVFSADGRLLACAGAHRANPGKIKVWDLTDGHQLCTLPSELAETPSLAFSPDGQLLACTTGRARLGLWEITDGNCRWSVALNRGVIEVAFTGDGALVIALCGDKTARALALIDGSFLRIVQPDKQDLP